MGVQLINNVALVSGVQHSDSVIHIHVSTFSNSFPIYIITEYWAEFPVYSRSQSLSILKISVWTCKTGILILYPWATWQIDGETVETVTDFILGGSKITADGDCSHEIKRRLLLGRKVITNLKSESESEVAQSCPILCDPMDCRLPGSSIHGIFQARILEWIAISFYRRSYQPRDWTQVSHIVRRHFTIWAT